MSNTTAAYMLNQYHSSTSPGLTFYRLFHMFSVHVWPPAFSQPESGWLAPPPHALSMLSIGGFLPLVRHIEFAITGRGAGYMQATRKQT